MSKKRRYSIYSAKAFAKQAKRIPITKNITIFAPSIKTALSKMHYLQHMLILLLLVQMPFASTAQENKEDGTPEAIPPLLGGRVWGQKAPFNNQCPKFNSDKRPPTGCVATAMAQIMAHHKHPLGDIASYTSIETFICP